MTKGYLALVLHAHLPYVRHPEYSFSLEEKWFFEAMTETYLPILSVLEKLQKEGINHAVTLSISPTLAAMWQDEYLINKYRAYLEKLLRLADLEVERTAAMQPFAPLARHYRDSFSLIYNRFFNDHHGDIITPLRNLTQSGQIELITSAATHGYLPFLTLQPEAVYAQAHTAIEQHTRLFGRAPRGIWLPECAYEYGLDEILAELGIHYFFVDTHSLLFAKPRPAFGPYSPVLTPAGTAAFARDDESGKQVWSKWEGYPGDFEYRDFYRDIGYDLPLDYVGPYIHPDGSRLHTGLKYYRITGKTEHKEPYDLEAAERKQAIHAGNFMFNRERQIEYLAGQMGRPPIVVAPYDAELFGHWWYEGPAWLENLCRKIHYEQDVFRLITPSEYLGLGLPLQEAEPSSSSWGNEGYHSVWLNGTNDWIYPHIHMAASRLIKAAADFPAAAALQKRVLDQMGRELLLAQASDWPFIMAAGTMTKYASERVENHIVRFTRLYDQLYGNNIDEAWLNKVCAADNIFPRFDYHAYTPFDKTEKIAVRTG